MNFAVWGDIHGDNAFLRWLIRMSLRAGAHYGIQVGDFGFTYRGPDGMAEVEDAIVQVAGDEEFQLDWLDGNHEGYSLMRALGLDVNGDVPIQVTDHVRYLPRGCRFDIDGASAMAFGGAVSVDREVRHIGVSYFYDEEITDHQISKVLDGDRSRVDFMFTHDVPDGVFTMESRMKRSEGFWPKDALRDSSHNRQRLSMVVDAVQPKVLIHGHMHHGYRDRRAGTKIIGLHCEAKPMDSIVVLDSENPMKEIDV